MLLQGLALRFLGQGYINTRGGKAGMSKRLLHGFKVNSASNVVCGHRVA